MKYGEWVVLRREDWRGYGVINKILIGCYENVCVFLKGVLGWIGKVLGIRF